MSLANIKIGQHNELLPNKTGDTDLVNCVSDQEGNLYSFVGSTLNNTYASTPFDPTKIVQTYRYKIYLPTERNVTVVLVQDAMASTKFYFYEYGGASEFGWTLIYTIDPTIYSYQSAFNPNFVTFQHKQFTAYVNESNKRYTLLYINTNVGVFKYGYVSHSVLAASSSAYLIDLSNWYLFDLGVVTNRISVYSSNFKQRPFYTLGFENCTYNPLFTIDSTNFDSYTQNELPLVLDLGVLVASATPFTDANTKISILCVVETIDGNLFLLRTAALDYFSPLTIQTIDIHFNIKAENDTSNKKLLAYVSKIHYFVRISTDLFSFSDSLATFKYATSVSLVNSTPFPELNTYYFAFNSTSKLAALKLGAVWAAKNINPSTILTTDLVSFLNYGVSLNGSSVASGGLWTPLIESINKNPYDTVFKDYEYYIKEGSSYTNVIVYQDIISSLQINSRLFTINNFNKLIYFTGFNGYGAANDRLLLAANLLKINNDIKPIKLDFYEQNLIVFGTDGVVSIVFGDSFPSSAYSFSLLKDVKVITKLCKVVKNIAFVFTNQGLFINSQNLLLNSLNALPTKISETIKDSIVVLNSKDEFDTTDFQCGVITDNNSLQYVLYWYNAGIMYIYSFSIQHGTWYKIKVGCVDHFLSLFYSPEDNGLIGFQTKNGAVSDLVELLFSFKRKNLLNLANENDSITLDNRLYINLSDLSDSFFVNLLAIFMNYANSTSCTINFYRSVNGNETLLGSFLVDQNKINFKALLPNLNNVSINTVYIFEFVFTAGSSYEFRNLQIDMQKSFPKV